MSVPVNGQAPGSENEPASKESGAKDSFLNFLDKLPDPPSTPQTSSRSRAGWHPPQPYPEFNVVIEQLPLEWKREENPSAISRDVSIAYHSEHGTFFIVVEQLAPHLAIDLAQVFRIHKERLSKQPWISTMLPDTSLTLGGIPFLHGGYEKQGLLQKESMTVSCGVHNGFVYQIFVKAVGPATDRFKETENEALRSFRILDIKRVAEGPPLAAAEDVTEAALGFETRWADNPNRRLWESLEREFPFAAAGALFEKGGGTFIMAFDLRGAEAEAEDIEATMLALCGYKLGDPSIVERRPYTHQGMKGRLFRVRTQSAQGTTFVHEIRVFYDAERAYCLSAFVNDWNTTTDAILVESFNGYVIKLEFNSDEAPLSPRAKESHGGFFNSLGLLAYQRREYGRAAKCFANATELWPQNPVYLKNTVDAYVQASRFEEAQKIIESDRENALKDSDIAARYAWLLADDGNLEEALELFAEVFARDYRDDDYFSYYAQSLLNSHRYDEACRALEKYRQGGDTSLLTSLHSRALLGNGDPEAALELLDSRRSTRETHRDLILSRVAVLQELERTDEALEHVNRLIQREGMTAETMSIKASLELDLGMTAKAKHTLESAVQSFPRDDKLQENLTYVAGLLGQGANDSIRTKIKPVPLLDGRPFGLSSRWNSDDREAGAAYLQLHTAIEMKAGQPLRQTDYMEVLIYDRRGAETFSSMQFGFDPTRQRVYVNELKVYDREENLLFEGNVDNFYVADDHAEFASNKKSVTAPLSGLKPGCRIVSVTTKEELFVRDAFPYLQQTFYSIFPVESRSVVVHADPAKYEFRPYGKIDVVKKGDSVQFSANELAAVVVEGLQPDPATYLPNVELGPKGKTWAEVGDEYLKIIAERLGNHHEVRSTAESITAEAKTRDEKIFAIADYVRDNLSYQGLEFGRHAMVMETAPKILENKYGDCKDHSYLLHELLTSIDIPCRLVLVNSTGKVNPDLPSLDQFDHMIAAAASEKGIRFIDCTNKFASTKTHSPSSLAGKQVLVVAQGASRLVEVPRTAFSELDVTIRRTIDLPGGSDLEVSEVVEMRNRLAAGYRSLFSASMTESPEGILQSMFSQVEPDVQLQSVKLTGSDAPDLPLKIELHYRIPRSLRDDREEWSGQVPALWEKLLLGVDYSAQRKNPFEWRHPLTFRSITTLQSKDGHAIVLKPDQRRLSNEFVDWRVASTPQAGGTQITAEALRKEGRFPPEKYAACYEALADFARESAVGFKIRKSSK